MNRKMLNKTAMLLVITTLFSLVTSMNIPNAIAVTPWISITPTRGVVGDLVTVNGAINTTNGDFAVRWNQTSTFNGTAVGNDVTISFQVPPITFTPDPYGSNVTVELIDRTPPETVVATTNFTLFAPRFQMSTETLPTLRQLQEGNETNIMINVTGGLPNTMYPANITVRNPANQNHSAIILLSNTTTTGSGNGTATYPTDFNGAHTNLTGTYYISSNLTINIAEFYIGLTDKTQYRRNEYIRAQAAGYKPSELVKVDITTEASISSFPRNLTASSSGMVTLTYKIPVNATPGTYHLTFTNTTVDGTVKTPTDAQNFIVIGIICSIQTLNLVNEAVQSASIEVYNASATTTVLNKGNTTASGWIRFNLDSGNYTFKAFIKNMQVGNLTNQVITTDKEFFMQLSLINFHFTVRTEENEAIPLIDIALKFNYTTRDNKIVAETTTTQTNASGMAALRNLFTNRTYRVEAERYGLLFSNTTVPVEFSPPSPLISLDLALPTHSLTIHAIDAKDRDAAEVDIKIYEWTSGIATSVESNETNLNGNASFSLPFGKYVLRAFKDEDFLSEMNVNLDEPLSINFNLVTLNLDVTVTILDFFSQPVANAEVKIERKIAQDFQPVSAPQLTSNAGSAQFAEIVGGDSRVEVYIGGRLVAVETQFLEAGSNNVALKVGEYVAILGYPIPTTAFALIIFILVLLVFSLVAARKRVTQIFRRSSK